MSDQPAAFAAALLAIVAVRSTRQPAARKTWKFLAAAIVIYNLGNLVDAYLRIADLTPFPSLADLFYLSFFPVLIAGIFVSLRASSLRVSWGRLLLDSLILVLGFGTFFWFFVISPAAAANEEELARFVLTQVYIALDCLMLMAIGVLLMNATAARCARRRSRCWPAGFGFMFLGDIVWAASVVVGQYISGDNFSDILYLACYAGLACAAQVQIRDKSRPERQNSAGGSALTQGIAYAGLGLSFFVLVYFAAGDGRSPVTIMTVAIFVLAILVMARQSVILRDDAKERQRKAVDLVEARFASLIRNASDVIMIVDSEGRIEYASPAVQRTFGLWQDDLVGRRLGEIWREADRERIAAFIAEVAATQGISIGPVEIPVGTKTRRFILECVGSNLLDDPAVKGLALNLRDVTERKALEDQLRQLAFHDPLTLLANRSLFRNRVEHALALSRRTQERLAVLMIDLDNFKNVNDSLGHDVGDRLLQTAAQRLVKCTRAADTVARLGGDEFAVLLEGVTTVEQAERIADLRHRGVPRPDRDRRQRNAGDRERRRRVLGSGRRHGERAAQCRHRDVQREVRRQGAARRVPLAHAGAAARAPAPRGRPEPGIHEGRVLPGVPADHRPQDQRAARRRGAGALAASGQRPHAARAVHPDGGGDGPDHRARALGARGCLPAGVRVAQEDAGG